LISNTVIACHGLNPFSFSWPTTKQGESLHFAALGQVFSCVVFCVFLVVESAGGLEIATVLEPDPETPGAQRFEAPMKRAIDPKSAPLIALEAGSMISE
jgi:hypothetical protein